MVDDEWQKKMDHIDRLRADMRDAARQIRQLFPNGGGRVGC